MLKRWHGRVGVLAASFVLLLAFTGLCLNHVSSWGFDSKALRSPALLGLYGMAESGTLVSYPLADGYISESNGQLFYQDDEIARCDGALVGAVTISVEASAQIVIACERQLLLFSPTFQLIEQIGPALGLPLAVQRVGLVDGQLLIATSAGLFFSDLNALSWISVNEEGSEAENENAVASATQWSQAAVAPERLSLALAGRIDSEDITYERLLLDIHSGRILGEWGVYLVDAMAILFMLLALSGVYIWLQGKKN
ncbi:MAG: PepSY domain-containing protein [Gammaproteobacteria bacterium]|nr:PepSY domain-containing protein [Gammaproteobacteria bacterium]